ncbi:MAG: hypothetical protein ABL956_05710 [Hyphomonadaceae bacterium]
MRDIDGRKLGAHDDPGAVLAKVQNRLASCNHLPALGIAPENDAACRGHDRHKLACAFKPKPGRIKICLRGRPRRKQAADAIKGLLRRLAHEFGLGRIGPDRGPAQRGKKLPRANLRAIIDHKRLDHPRGGERQGRLAFVGNQSAGSKRTSLLTPFDAVDFHLNGRRGLGSGRLRRGLGRGTGGQESQSRRQQSRSHGHSPSTAV